jgi:polar amino acid transport system substrate-binding protein
MPHLISKSDCLFLAKKNLMKICKPLFLLLTIVIISALSPLIAQEQVNRILNKGEIRVGMTGTQPPFSVKSKSDDLIGYEVDLAKYLAESMGVELKLVELEFSKLIPALEKGSIDMIMSGMTITPKRNSRVAFVGPHMVAGKSILTKSDVYSRTKNTEELNTEGIRVAALASSTSEDFVKGYLPKTQLTPVANYDEGIQLIIDGKVEVMVADFSICAYSVLVHQDKGLVTLDQPLTIEPLGIALPPNDPLFINLVENYLMNLELAGVLRRMEEKWFENGNWLLQVKQ